MNDALARLSGVTRSYGEIRALADVSLEIEAGQIVGLLGPNGAGKTTLINLLVGLRRPDAGTVELCGGDPRVAATRQLIGVTPQDTALPDPWRVSELVDFVAAHYADPLDPAELLARFHLADTHQRQIGGLSGGQQRRLAVALAFVGRPALVFLDEPSTGLDVEARRQLWDGIRAFHAAGGTVLLTSHYLDEVESLAHRVVVIDHGRVLADGSVAEIRSLVRLKRVALSCGQLPPLPGVARLEHDGDRTVLLSNDAEELLRALVHADVAFSDIEVQAASLEEAFLALTADQQPTPT